jgi:hypothetical protein
MKCSSACESYVFGWGDAISVEIDEMADLPPAQLERDEMNSKNKKRMDRSEMVRFIVDRIHFLGSIDFPHR